MVLLIKRAFYVVLFVNILLFSINSGELFLWLALASNNSDAKLVLTDELVNIIAYGFAIVALLGLVRNRKRLYLWVWFAALAGFTIVVGSEWIDKFSDHSVATFSEHSVAIKSLLITFVAQDILTLSGIILYIVRWLKGGLSG